jgi:hypothetical protein
MCSSDDLGIIILNENYNIIIILKFLEAQDDDK